MRNTHIDLHDALDRALVAIGNDIRPDTCWTRTRTGARSCCTAPPASCWC